MTIVVPEQYEKTIKHGKNDLCKLVQDTCVVQISGGYAMLAKERELGTVIIYARGENTFSDPNTLKHMLSEIDNDRKSVYNFTDAVCIDNSINIGVNEAYKFTSSLY
jgi:hypothetical protein